MRERRREDEGQRREQQQAHVRHGARGVKVLLLVFQPSEEEAAPQHQQHVREHGPQQRRLPRVVS